MSALIPICSLLAAISSAGTGRQLADVSPPSIELPQELARVLTDYEAAYRRGGRDLAALFTEDGFVLTGGRPPIQGRAAIAQYYAGGGGPLALRAIAFAVDGSVGYIIGGYAEKPGQPDAGKFTLTLRKGSDGRWLIASDMENPNRAQRQQPNLSGVWRLDPSQSRMIGGEGSDMQLTWTVVHEDPNIAVTVSTADGGGSREFRFSCTTNGRECVNELPSLREVRRSTATWEGTVLVMRTDAITPDGGFKAVDRIQTMDNHQTLVFDRTVSDARGERRVKQVFRRVR